MGDVQAAKTDRDAMSVLSDDVINVGTCRHTFTDKNGLVYEVYYAGFNLTKNMASDDVAFVTVKHNGKTYNNLSSINKCEYASIDYILTNDAGWRKWKALDKPKWTHAHTEITEITIVGTHMEWTVDQGDHSTPHIGKFSFYETC